MHENRGASWKFEFFANFGKIISPELEVHMCEMGELWHTLSHENIALDKTHELDCLLETFKNFELCLVPD